MTNELTQSRARLLNAIGLHPYYNISQLSECTGLSESTVRSCLSWLREYHCVVASPLADKDLNWEMTGTGRRVIESYLEQLLDYFEISYHTIPKYHVYMPPHIQDNLSRVRT